MYFVSGEDENPNGIGLLRKTLRWLVRCNLRQAVVVFLVTHNSPFFLNGGSVDVANIFASNRTV